MHHLNLKVRQRVVYKVTTKRKHSGAVADDLLNQNFNPVGMECSPSAMRRCEVKSLSQDASLGWVLEGWEEHEPIKPRLWVEMSPPHTRLNRCIQTEANHS